MYQQTYSCKDATSIQRKILNFCQTVKDSFPQAEIVYTRGSCYKFFKILESAFPELNPIAYHTPDHVIAKIGKYFYDINGLVEDTDKYIPLNDEPNTLAFYDGSKVDDLDPTTPTYKTGPCFDFRDGSKFGLWYHNSEEIKGRWSQWNKLIRHLFLMFSTRSFKHLSFTTDGELIEEGQLLELTDFQGNVTRGQVLQKGGFPINYVELLDGNWIWLYSIEDYYAKIEKVRSICQSNNLNKAS